MLYALNCILPIYFSYSYTMISYIDYWKDKESYHSFKNVLDRFDLLFFNIYILIPSTLGILFYINPIINYYDTFKKEMYMFFLNIVFGELWFYVLHRINHTRTLYQYIHKIHHKDPNPIGILAFYSHPLECLFVNVFSSYIIHYFYTISLFQYMFFITFVNINTIFYSHSSKSFENSTHHIHHKLLNYNFGFSLFADKLFGTEKLIN